MVNRALNETFTKHDINNMSDMQNFFLSYFSGCYDNKRKQEIEEVTEILNSENG